MRNYTIFSRIIPLVVENKGKRSPGSFCRPLKQKKVRENPRTFFFQVQSKVNYLTSTSAPAFLSCSAIFSASSLAMASLLLRLSRCPSFIMSAAN